MSYEGHPDQRYGPTTYSYCGEDLMLLNLFELMGIFKPSYLDIGAHHPFTISNTALMYSRGSRGVNVEANPYLMEPFKEHRPCDINVNVGVGVRPGTMKFFMWDDRSGRNTFSEEWAGKLEVLTKVIELPVTTLENIVNEYCSGIFPDLLTMDIEGFDYEVLESANFYESRPKIICVEAGPEESLRFKAMMGTKGFSFYSRHGLEMIFVQDKYFPKVTC